MADALSTGYLVRLEDGPAEGFSYYTMLEPDETIVMAPIPGRGGEFMRVLAGGDPWPGQVSYRRDRSREEMLVDEDVLIAYRLV